MAKIIFSQKAIQALTLIFAPRKQLATGNMQINPEMQVCLQKNEIFFSWLYKQEL
jgi:hypothetical protein